MNSDSPSSHPLCFPSPPSHTPRRIVPRCIRISPFLARSIRWPLALRELQPVQPQSHLLFHVLLIGLTLLLTQVPTRIIVGAAPVFPAHCAREPTRINIRQRVVIHIRIPIEVPLLRRRRNDRLRRNEPPNHRIRHAAVDMIEAHPSEDGLSRIALPRDAVSEVSSAGGRSIRPRRYSRPQTMGRE